MHTKTPTTAELRYSTLGTCPSARYDVKAGSVTTITLYSDSTRAPNGHADLGIPESEILERSTDRVEPVVRWKLHFWTIHDGKTLDLLVSTQHIGIIFGFSERSD